MRDYFSDVKEYLNSYYKLTIKSEKKETLVINSVLHNFSLNESAKYIYGYPDRAAECYYKAFEAVWHNENNKYIGSINFVPDICLEKEHEELIDIMDECYDVKLDELDIVEDIMHWYPLFYFPNGDAFCLDIRNGTVVFYEHEIYEGEKNLHGLLIATSINDLYEKWSGFHFKDVYDWSEVVNEEGIDLSCEVIRKYL